MVRICCFQFVFYITFSKNTSNYQEKSENLSDTCVICSTCSLQTLIRCLYIYSTKYIAAVELQLPKPRSMYTMYTQVPLKFCAHIVKAVENVAMKEEIQDEPKAESPLVIYIRCARVETACLCHFGGDDPISQQSLFIQFTTV